MNKTPTITELNALYAGVHILVLDPNHADYGRECAFVEMVEDPYGEYPLMKVKLMTEDRFLELRYSQIIFIVEDDVLPSTKDN